MNNLVQSIKFTHELQENNEIAFLHLLIIQKDSALSFKIFRKPTSRNQLLHSFSEHPDYIKRNIIYNTFSRSLNITDPVFMDDEIEFVYQQFLSLGYTRNYIQRQYYKPAPVSMVIIFWNPVISLQIS